MLSSYYAYRQISDRDIISRRFSCGASKFYSNSFDKHQLLNRDSVIYVSTPNHGDNIGLTVCKNISIFLKRHNSSVK